MDNYMSLLERIINRATEEGYVSPSLVPLIFGNEEEWDEYDEGSFTIIAYSVCSFYFSLLQSYYIGKAQSRGITVSQLGEKKQITDQILRTWGENGSLDFENPAILFSCLSDYARYADMPAVCNETEEYIKKVNHAYNKFYGEKNGENKIRYQSVNPFFDRDDLKGLLKSLPLLAITEFDSRQMKFIFSADGERFSIKCIPFLSFFASDDGLFNQTVDYATGSCYALTSVSRGEKNDELHFETIELNSLNAMPRRRKIARSVANDESLILICKTVGISTQWYSYFCDFSLFIDFAKHLQDALLSHFRIYSDIQSNRNISDVVLKVFGASSVYSAAPTNLVINVYELTDIIVNIFLSDGVFKATEYLFLNTVEQGERGGDKITRFFRNLLNDISSCKPVDINALTRKCEDSISTSLAKLTYIVPKNSKAYKQRAEEIRAEQQTVCALEAFGIKSDNLFVDEESILSINDYFDMILNNTTELEDDLKQVLLTLICFYRALVLQSQEIFDSGKYFKDLAKIRAEYNSAELSWEALFDEFIAFTKEHASDAAIKNHLGRNSIDDKIDKKLASLKQMISDAKGQVQDTEDKPYYLHDVFISYSHADKAKVKPIVERWRTMGLDVFFDETDIHPGANWVQTAFNSIGSPMCKMVVAFVSKNSLISENVEAELAFAKKEAEKRFTDGAEHFADEFIVPVNLEDISIDAQISEITLATVADSDGRLTAADIKAHRQTANSQKKVLHPENTFINYYDATIDDAIFRSFETMKKFSRYDGTVVVPKEFTQLQLSIANFYSYMKFGDKYIYYRSKSELEAFFNRSSSIPVKCIFPMVTSLKETRIKRDNLTIVGYEIITGKGRENTSTNYILSSHKLTVDDYYCVPKYHSTGENCLWMIEPLLISCKRFTDIMGNGEVK